MATKQKGGKSIRLNLPVDVEVKRVPIRPSSTLAYLDTARLDRAAKAEFALGEIDGGGCRGTVYAVVRRGMITGLRLEGCHDNGKLDPKMAKLLREVRKRLFPGDRPERPLRVSEYLRQQVPERSHCYRICIFWFCFTCCGFPSDDKSWSCSNTGGTYERYPD